MNKNELIQLRNGWLQQASADLSTRLIDFMEQNQLNENDLAEILALDVNQIRNMLNGAQNVTLLEFATLLIATGNVLRIEPIAASPFARASKARPVASHAMPQRDANGRFVSRNQPEPKRKPSGHRGADGRFAPMGGMPMPPMGGMPMPPMGGVPYPQPNGSLSEQFGGMPGIRRQRPMPQPVVAEPSDAGKELTEWDAMKRSELVSVVRQNHWDSEIDLDEADKSQIIAFLESKSTPAQPEVAPNGNASQMMQMLMAELANNPQMMQQLQAQMAKTNR